VAKKYFGDEEPVGKTINILSSKDKQIAFTVHGIIKDIPPNTHLHFNIFVPFTMLEKLVWWVDFNHWGDSSYYTYVLLQKESPVSEISKNITECCRRYSEQSSIFFLQRLSQVHFSTEYILDLPGSIDIQYIYIFSVIAFFVLLIACINFINLSTARFSMRSKEVGLRKTVGADRIHLIKQFLGESIFITIISFFITLILIAIIQPFFNQFTGKQLSIEYTDFGLVIKLLAIVIFTGVISGSYPALFLSAFKPVQALKETVNSTSKGKLFRKLLVVLQFSLSIIIVICTTIVFSQLNFLRDRKLGFDKENIICIPSQGDLSKNYNVVKNEILQNPDILAVTAAYHSLTYVPTASTGVHFEGKEILEKVSIKFLPVNINFLEVLNMKMVEGRYFSEEFSSDRQDAIIINEALAHTIGEKSLLGKSLKNHNDSSERRIIGIVENFHFKSLHSSVEPLVLVPLKWNPRNIFVKVKQGKISQSIIFLENIWKKYGPGSEFEYNFLDKTIDTLYLAEQQMSRLLSCFACLAILIASLGLFGLASFTAERRTKEIGIRKVLGASGSGIIVMLSLDFTKWVLLANFIAWPVAYFAMNKWLQNFPYRIEIGLWTFLLAGALAMVIALLTVSYQAYRAAVANPVDALKYE